MTPIGLLGLHAPAGSIRDDRASDGAGVARFVLELRTRGVAPLTDVARARHRVPAAVAAVAGGATVDPASVVISRTVPPGHPHEATIRLTGQITLRGRVATQDLARGLARGLYDSLDWAAAPRAPTIPAAILPQHGGPILDALRGASRGVISGADLTFTPAPAAPAPQGPCVVRPYDGFYLRPSPTFARTGPHYPAGTDLVLLARTDAVQGSLRLYRVRVVRDGREGFVAMTFRDTTRPGAGGCPPGGNIPQEHVTLGQHTTPTPTPTPTPGGAGPGARPPPRPRPPGGGTTLQRSPVQVSPSPSQVPWGTIGVSAALAGATFVLVRHRRRIRAAVDRWRR